MSFALSLFAHKNRTIEPCSSVVHPQARSPFSLLKLASEHMLLPNDTHRKTISSITTVLLPFVTYLLTLRRSLLKRNRCFGETFGLLLQYWRIRQATNKYESRRK
jgi:hypothetical protein